MSDLFAPPSSPTPGSTPSMPVDAVPPAPHQQHQPPAPQAPAPGPGPQSSTAQPPANVLPITPGVAPGISPADSSPHPGQASPPPPAPGVLNPYGPPRPLPLGQVHAASGARPQGPSRVLVGVLAGIAGLVIGGVGATALTLAVVAGNELLADAAAEPWPAGPAPDEEEWDGYHEEDQLAGQDGGTVEDPWVLDEEVYTDEWSVLLDIPYEATAEILAYNDVNAAPDEGMEYWIVPVHATYYGPSSTVTAHGSIDLWLVGPDGTEYSGSCGDTPSPLVGTGLIGTDDSVDGNVCVAVPAGAPGVWGLMVDDSYPVYLSVDASEVGL